MIFGRNTIEAMLCSVSAAYYEAHDVNFYYLVRVFLKAFPAVKLIISMLYLLFIKLCFVEML